MSANQTTTWPEALADALLQGVELEDAVQTFVAAGIAEDDLRTAARYMVSHPVFTVSKRYVTRLQARDWFLAAFGSVQSVADNATVLDERDGISKEAFRDEFYTKNRPICLRGIGAEWPAVRKWDAQYLKARCGGEAVEVMTRRSNAHVSEQNTASRLKESMSFERFIDLVYGNGPTNDYYMVSRNRFFEQSGTRDLLDDIAGLPFVDTHAPGDGVKMWFGPGGTITPLHHDDRNNTIVQVVGSKHVRLIAPWYSERMAQSQWWYAGVDPTQIDKGDAQRTPELSVTLQPGDALFIPVGWWHAVVSHSVSITLAFVAFDWPNRFERVSVASSTAGRRLLSQSA